MRILLLLLGVVGGAVALGRGRQPFDHAKHQKLFPTCEGCHAGASDPAGAIYPTAESCATCHDGTVEKRVDWSPPAGVVSNLRFTHTEHRRATQKKLPQDSVLACTACHTPPGGAWMTVQRALPTQCLDCHGLRVAHLSAPDSACATCHLTLAEATTLPLIRVASFEKPASHDDPAFPSAKGHGAAAKRGDRSCAVCHARDFCAECHVNAPEVPAIQALAADPRSLAIKAPLKAPASHADGRFLSRHGGQSRRDARTCAACHTQESCIACHRSQPSVALALPASGAGRGTGARVERKRPDSHFADFADRHGPLASATPGTCAACHARAECLECHRPNAGAAGSYHPAGFLTRHPAAANNRQTDCAGCHNQATFCTSCHVQSGLVARGRLQPGYHDVNGAFLLGHGVAARQNLESCVTCHSERDCLTCHSAQSGGRFNPHGPGFDAARLRQRNPQTCAACHGRDIPGN